MNEARIVERITKFFQEEFKSRNAEHGVIGISGGLDSAVTAYLAVKALGPKHVYGLLIPDSSVTPKKDTQDGLKVVANLGIRYKIINIGEVRKQILRNFPKDKLARANFLVRLRMAILYYYASVKKGLVIGTADKSELQIGYFTKYGDGGADLFPIGELYKTDVRKLARFLDIPENIIEKKSSARLWKGQTAEGEIGVSYEKIDTILKEIDKSKKRKDSIPYDLIKINGIDENEVKTVIKWINKNKHKHEFPIPVCKLDQKLFI